MFSVAFLVYKRELFVPDPTERIKPVVAEKFEFHVQNELVSEKRTKNHGILVHRQKLAFNFIFKSACVILSNATLLGESSL